MSTSRRDLSTEVCVLPTNILPSVDRYALQVMKFSQCLFTLLWVWADNYLDTWAWTKTSRWSKQDCRKLWTVRCFILGDFNICDLASLLPTLHQYIDCPTRRTRTPDRWFGNFPDAYKAQCRVPLGKSDHHIIHLLLTYMVKVKREKSTTEDIQLWDTRSKEMLQDCFIDIDWYRYRLIGKCFLVVAVTAMNCQTVNFVRLTPLLRKLLEYIQIPKEASADIWQLPLLVMIWIYSG